MRLATITASFPPARTAVFFLHLLLVWPLQIWSLQRRHELDGQIRAARVQQLDRLERAVAERRAALAKRASAPRLSTGALLWSSTSVSASTLTLGATSGTITLSAGSALTLDSVGRITAVTTRPPPVTR